MEYNIEYQQVVNVNVEDKVYTLNLLGSILNIGNVANGESPIVIPNILIEFFSGTARNSIDLSDYIEDSRSYYPILVADDLIAAHIASYCLYISDSTEFTYFTDNTSAASSSNTLVLFPLAQEIPIVTGLTNGQYYGNNNRFYSKTETNNLLNEKQDKLTAGENINISEDGIISADDTTYSNFVGADGTNAGEAGLVPAPAATDNGKYLKGNGTFSQVAYSEISGTPSLSGYQTTANLVTSVDSSSTDNQYPSAKLFYDTCGDIETLINAL